MTKRCIRDRVTTPDGNVTELDNGGKVDPDYKNDGNDDVIIPNPTGVKLDQTELSLTVGDTAQLTASVAVSYTHLDVYKRHAEYRKGDEKALGAVQEPHGAGRVDGHGQQDDGYHLGGEYVPVGAGGGIQLVDLQYEDAHERCV